MSVMLPNGPLQVVFSFDTTTSMDAALVEVRGRLSDMLQRLQTDLPAVTTAVVAHGDYCDEESEYITKHIDFSSNLPELVDFVNKVEGTWGGDEPEAYEVMLRLVRKDLNWKPCSQRVLVVIGDSFPHESDDVQNKDRIDWKEEVQLLKAMGVRIYGVQVKSREASTQFFQTMASQTDGQHLNLSQFGTLCDVLMAICYREKGAEFLQNYEAEVRAREGRKKLHKDLEGVFGVLRRADSSASSSALPAVSTAIKRSPVTTATKLSPVTTAAKLSPVTTAAKLSPVSKAIKLVKKARKTTAPASHGVIPRNKRFAKAKAAITTRKLNREKVPDTNFRFNQLRWSPWKLIAVPVAEATEVTKGGQWHRFLRGAARARGGSVLGDSYSARRGQALVMCEVAVQTRPGARRHVIWCRVLPVSSASRKSSSRLLAAPSVRAQLAHVIRSGCRVWTRWANVRGQEKKLKQEVNDVYDYAWCCNSRCMREVWVPNGVSSHKVQIAGTLS